MKKSLLISLASLAGLLLVAGTASAWETRTLTLGDQNRFVEDDANIWLYPQRVMKYGDRLYLDLARKEGGVVDSAGEAEGLDAIKTLNGGFFLDIAESFHMAFWASEYTDMTTTNYLMRADESENEPTGCGSAGDADPNACGFMSNQDIAGGLMDRGANRKFDVFAGWSLADNFDMGAHLWFGKGSFDYFQERTINRNPDRSQDGGSQSTELKFSSQVFGLGLGATVDLFPDSTLDLGLRYANYSYSNNRQTVPQPVVDGGNQFSFDTRWTTRLSKHWFLVPAMQFNYTKFTGIVDAAITAGDGLGSTSTTIDWTKVNFDLGLGLQMKVIGKASLYTAVGIDYDQDKYDSLSNYGASRIITYTTLQLPYWRTGFEAPLFDWMDFRAGFIKRWGTWQRVDDFLDPGNIKTNEDWYRRRETYLEDVTYSLDEAHSQAAQDYNGIAPLDFETFVGATMKYNGWYFTTEIDPNFLFHGPFNTMVGEAEEGALAGDRPWFARFEISYRF